MSTNPNYPYNYKGTHNFIDDAIQNGPNEFFHFNDDSKRLMFLMICISRYAGRITAFRALLKMLETFPLGLIMRDLDLMILPKCRPVAFWMFPNLWYGTSRRVYFCRHN